MKNLTTKMMMIAMLFLCGNLMAQTVAYPPLPAGLDVNIQAISVTSTEIEFEISVDMDPNLIEGVTVFDSPSPNNTVTNLPTHSPEILKSSDRFVWSYPQIGERYDMIIEFLVTFPLSPAAGRTVVGSSDTATGTATRSYQVVSSDRRRSDNSPQGTTRGVTATFSCIVTIHP